MRKLRPSERAVNDRSISLFRLAEACNNDCPMCSNSGRPEAWFTAEEALLARVDFLARQGFRRVVLTGGEPTIHPAFWEVVEALRTRSMRWDINTHGRSFAAAGVAQRGGGRCRDRRPVVRGRCGFARRRQPAARRTAL